MNRRSVLLTGATGSLGSELLLSLIKKGYEVVCLIRPTKEHTAAARLNRMVGDAQSVHVITGDVSLPYCGVPAYQRSALRGGSALFVHCAASIKLSDEKAARVTNINGVGNALALAEDIGTTAFHHVSTAYVAGGAEKLLESDEPTERAHPPRNCYERSKQIGEALVRGWGSRGGERRFSVYRPSILVGRTDGTTPAFDGYYGYFNPIHRIASAMRLRLNSGKALPPEVRVCEDGNVQLPIVLLRSSSSTLNLVPVDLVAEMIAELVDVPARNQSYHLVDGTPMLVREVIDTSLGYLGVTDAVCTDHPEARAAALRSRSPLLARLQQRVDVVHRGHWPYVTHEAKFEHTAARMALGLRFRETPRMNVHFLHKLLAYAVAVGFDNRKRHAEPVEIPA